MTNLGLRQHVEAPLNQRKKMKSKLSILIVIIGGIGCLATGSLYAVEPISPTAMVLNGTDLYIADKTGNAIKKFSITTNTVADTFPLNASPSGIAIGPDALYVTAGGLNGVLLALNELNGTVLTTIDVGHTPVSPVISLIDNRLYLANRFSNSISVIDLGTNQESVIPVGREPIAIALTPDERKLVVSHHLPEGPADDSESGLAVSIIETQSNTVTNVIGLYDGTSGARGIAVSPDGIYAYVTHLVGRYKMPTTQIERGWIWTNAMSVIKIATAELVNTVLLDDTYAGAANPWAIACSQDGQYLCVTHAGSHEVSVIDRLGLRDRLDDVAAGIPVPGGFSEVADDVPNDLAFLAGIRKRVELSGNGPRSIVLTSGNQAYTGQYFSGTLETFDIASTTPTVISHSLGTQPAADPVRLGEQYFNDGSITFQKWLSCASCHPDGRSDGLNWDLGNDGLGSPRNVKSLLSAHYTGITTVTGVRPGAEASVRAGFKFIEFMESSEEIALPVDAYLKSLKPVLSPYRDSNGQLTAEAWNGKYLFHGKANCASCHSDTDYSDSSDVFYVPGVDPEDLRVLHNVGTGRTAEEKNDTPTLVEVWRTAPYLQDGRAATMMEVLTTYNPDDKHGMTSTLSAQELLDLEQYVLSISYIAKESDIDESGEIEVSDLYVFVQDWLEKDCGLCNFADMDDDNDVDLVDFSEIAKTWMTFNYDYRDETD